mgnify:CR=1 FL=1
MLPVEPACCAIIAAVALVKLAEILKKINSSGVVEWSRIYEKSEDDNINNVKQTSDGGYIATGYCIDDDTWDYQAWTFKLDSLGEVEWEDVFVSTNKGNTGEDVIETSDVGFVIKGNKDKRSAIFDFAKENGLKILSLNQFLI